MCVLQRPLDDGFVYAEGTEYPEQGQQHPYMLMLVPTSSVRWGGRALDNSTDQGNDEQQGDAEEGVGATSTWLEIGCNVLHARVVSNVKFTTTM